MHQLVQGGGGHGFSLGNPEVGFFIRECVEGPAKPTDHIQTYFFYNFHYIHSSGNVPTGFALYTRNTGGTHFTGYTLIIFDIEY